MSHVPHELHEEFPSDHDVIVALKAGNAHFAKLAERYHEVNRDIHRIETDVEPAADEVLEVMKKERLKMKDEIAQLISAAK